MKIYENPYFTTVGMTDESLRDSLWLTSGTISEKYQEDSEEIQVILADREEVRRILKEEQVALICAYQMMHFLQVGTVWVFGGASRLIKFLV